MILIDSELLDSTKLVVNGSEHQPRALKFVFTTLLIKKNINKRYHLKICRSEGIPGMSLLKALMHYQEVLDLAVRLNVVKELQW